MANLYTDVAELMSKHRFMVKAPAYMAKQHDIHMAGQLPPIFEPVNPSAMTTIVMTIHNMVEAYGEYNFPGNESLPYYEQEPNIKIKMDDMITIYHTLGSYMDYVKDSLHMPTIKEYCSDVEYFKGKLKDRILFEAKLKGMEGIEAKLGMDTSILSKMLKGVY